MSDTKFDTFDKFLEVQGDEVKSLYETHTTGLMNTVKATRQERDDLAKELKSLAKKIDVDSEAGKQVGELQARLQAAEKKANFLELAAKQGVKRPSAAFAIANAENLFLEDGSPDWNKIKESVPELFSQQAIGSDAGSGTNKRQEGNFNANIRKALRNRHK